MSAKNRDEHNRFRNQTIGFRVSPEENEQINFVVSLSGMTKQDYIVRKLQDREIVVHGNCRLHKALEDRLDDLLIELRRIEDASTISGELNDNIGLVLKIIDKLYNK